MNDKGNRARTGKKYERMIIVTKDEHIVKERA